MCFLIFSFQVIPDHLTKGASDFQGAFNFRARLAYALRLISDIDIGNAFLLEYD